MRELETLKERINHLEELVKREAIKKDVYQTGKLQLELSKKDKEGMTDTLLQVMELFKKLGGTREEELLRKLETFINYGLALVFQDKEQFIASIDSSGKDIRVDFFIKTGEAVCDVTEAKGGGVAEVVSILLQIFFVAVMRGTLAPILIMDTGLVHLSDHYHKAMSMLLRDLCHNLGMQVILLTHAGDYGESADVLYQFTQEEGKTLCRRTK
jgi:hypothetical protein